MKKLLSLLALMGLFIFAPAKDSVAQETAGGIKIAVININAILRKGTAFISIRDQIVKFRETFRNEIQKEEEALRNANQELARQRTLLSAEAFAEKRRKFEKRVTDVQRLVQQRKVNLDRARAEAMGKIQKVLNEIVTAIAKEQNISLILRKDQTILADTPLQITKEVLQRLNTKMPTIKVVEPAK